MNHIKRILMTLLALITFTGSWAIEQDADGYYLIGSVQDWKDFSALVQSTPAINARMTADIDLGDDQTVIGSPINGGQNWYQGTFDGDGHTLTIAYNNTSGEVFTTPFSLIQGATIKNLHLDGTVHTVYAYGGSIASIGRGSNTLKNIWNSVSSVCEMGGWVQMGTLFGVLDSGASLDVSDCLFTGSMSHNGAYCGYFTGCYGPGPKVSDCLVLGEFTGGYGFNGSFTNCYLKHASTEGVTIPTDEQLADGTIAAALGDAWVQDPVTNQPMLKLFVSLKQDADGYYEIGSVQDWQNFAKLVENTPNANAKMTADIDLGDDQTVIGARTVSTTAYSLGSGSHYSGVFDGQGQTLTVAYKATGTDSASPFSSIEGATIKNLHVAGTMVSPKACGAGVASATGGTGNLIQNVWVSATITGNGQDWNCSAGIVGCVKNGSVTINDCMFTGSVTSSQSHNGCFVGYIDSGSAAINNSLSTGTFSYGHCAFQGTHVKCYVKSFPVAYPTGVTQPTDDELSNGTTTAALNADRTGDEAPWVQQGDQPMLKVFASEGGIITGSQRSKGIGQRDGWYTIDGRKLYGKPTKKGIYINNGNKVVIK